MVGSAGGVKVSRIGPGTKHGSANDLSSRPCQDCHHIQERDGDLRHTEVSALPTPGSVTWKNRHLLQATGSVANLGLGAAILSLCLQVNPPADPESVACPLQV